jgi:hypothetical protein
MRNNLTAPLVANADQLQFFNSNGSFLGQFGQTGATGFNLVAQVSWGSAAGGNSVWGAGAAPANAQNAAAGVPGKPGSGYGAGGSGGFQNNISS